MMGFQHKYLGGIPQIRNMIRGFRDYEGLADLLRLVKPYYLGGGCIFRGPMAVLC